MRFVLLALVLSSFASAHAASTCLVAPFTLDDQRDLASLRVATEAACPCATATSRGTYQRCARGVIDVALASSELRPDCLKAARDVAKGATCGGDKVPCGQIRVRDGEIACKTSKATACRNSSKVTKSACSAETHCADVLEWAAGTCNDVRDAGAYAPGFREIVYVKDSVNSPGTPRTLATSIWYPAPAGSGPVANTGGVTNAPVDASGGPYPLVLFSHGSCGYPQQSLFLTPFLATHGFIVVAPPHPGNTLFEFPNCRTPQAQAASFVERPADVRFVLDQILAANADPGSPFFGTIDPDRIAMTGHSFGGLTTYLVTASEPRVKAAVAMAPATIANSALSVPSLTMLGVIDSVVSNPNARAAYGRSVSPKWLVEIEHAGHYAFSDFCFASSDCNPPTTLDSLEAHDAALRYVLPFLKVHVTGDDAWAPLLEPPTRGGFVYTAE